MKNQVLDNLPRLGLGTLPTPLLPAKRLSHALGDTEIWFKRDDLTGFAMGGNKVRTLDFVGVHALEQGADTLITGGGVQSNHVRVTMAVAAVLGMQGVAVFHGEKPSQLSGNLILDQLYGADLVFTEDPDRSNLDGHIEEQERLAKASGRKPYVIGRGGASALGGMGYVDAARELSGQFAHLGWTPDHLVCAAGSCGTMAGLLVGMKWLGLTCRLTGVTVSRSRNECVDRVVRLAGETAEMMGLDLTFGPADFDLIDGYIGEGYAIPTKAGAEAAREVARLEGLVLDPVYTAKMMAGVMGMVRSGGLWGRVVVLCSGGGPAVF